VIKIELEDSEPVVAQLRTLTEVMQRRQAEYEAGQPERRRKGKAPTDQLASLR